MQIRISEIYICTFVPIAFETIGPISKHSQRFTRDRAKRMEADKGDIREGGYLKQVLS